MRCDWHSSHVSLDSSGTWQLDGSGDGRRAHHHRPATSRVEQATAMKGRGAINAIVGHFGRPRGLLGNLAGWMMGNRPSNRQRNSWVVSLLDVQPTDRVLEVGFGPGLAIAELARHIGPAGHVYGIDHSDVMLRHATKRNADAIRDGRVTLVQAPVEELPPTIDGPFDAIIAVNTIGFWAAPVRQLEELRRRLVPGGRIAVAVQPRYPGATKDPTRISHQRMDLLRNAGFTEMRSEVLYLKTPVICVLAINRR